LANVDIALLSYSAGGSTKREVLACGAFVTPFFLGGGIEVVDS